MSETEYKRTQDKLSQAYYLSMAALLGVVGGFLNAPIAAWTVIGISVAICAIGAMHARHYLHQLMRSHNKQNTQ